ncbi:STAS domain-containing protein [Salegentibacter sp. HM20]
MIKLVGELNSKNVSEIENRLNESLLEYESLTIDLNGLDLIDISGIFMLSTFQRTARRNRKKVICLLNSCEKIMVNPMGIKVPDLE